MKMYTGSKVSPLPDYTFLSRTVMHVVT